VNARWARRDLVLAALVVCAFMASGLPGSLHGTGIVLVLVLAIIDVALIRATGGLAFAPARSLDERQARLRDLAYRRGFRLLGLAQVVALAVAFLGTYINVLVTFRSDAGLSQVDSGISGRFLVAFLELLLMMPTMVIAWMEPDRADDDPRPARGLWALLAVPAVAAAWLLAVTWAPAQAAASSRSTFVDSTVANATCRHFVGGRIVGAEFGATVGARVQVCWNGQQAFVVGDPSAPAPGAGETSPPRAPILTACGADNADDFALVSGVTCKATTDANGTLRYTVRSRVSPLPLGIAEREVAMSLVVTRDGRVLEHP